MNPSQEPETVELELPPTSQLPPPAAAAVQVKVDTAGLTHTGKVRTRNEDHFLVVSFGRFLETFQTSLPRGEIPILAKETGYGFLVADGMGGHAAGEVASRVAITTMVDLFLSTPDWILRLVDDAHREEVLRRMVERFGQINQVMVGKANADPHLAGFGTTMTVVGSLGREFVLGHLGDSRAYLFRGGKLTRLTRDHTLAQELADRGVIRQQDVATHYFRNMLTRVLRHQEQAAEPDVGRYTLEDGDSLLLCTDGLTGMVPDDAIAGTLAAASDAGDACRELIDQALAGGGRDNVTVVVARYHISESA